MLNLNSVLVVFFLFLGTHLLNVIKEKDADVTSQVTDNLLTTTFMLYADSLATFKKNHPSHTGAVTTQLPLPHWLAKNPEIKTSIHHGIGYVYMPSKPSLYQSLMTATENSSRLGVTNARQLITPTEAISKPSFIPKDYIVYLR